jgi:hypothetical protein
MAPPKPPKPPKTRKQPKAPGDLVPRPLEPRLEKEERKALAGRLRKLLRQAPLNMREMALALEVEPEVVVIALRELRARKRGQLRSTIRLGHASWWWEDPPEEPEAPAVRAKAGKKERKKK